MFKTLKTASLSLVAAGVIGCLWADSSDLCLGETPAATRDDEAKTDEAKSIYDFEVKTIKGEKVDLSKYKGKTVLLVNVASKCGYTKQYADMQKVYDKYKDQGFVILGFPCNQFGGQEPGTESEILEFCQENYGVTFPMFSKVEVNGEGKAPLYKYLTALETAPKAAGDISWNFEKFLIGPDGKVVGRYSSKVTPGSKEMTEKIEALLPESTVEQE